MKIESIPYINLNRTENQVQKSNEIDFFQFLNKELNKINDTQIKAEKAAMDLITGEATDIHQVMIATEEARLSLELAVGIRNKLVDAYQELTRLQI